MDLRSEMLDLDRKIGQKHQIYKQVITFSKALNQRDPMNILVQISVLVAESNFFNLKKAFECQTMNKQLKLPKEQSG